MIEIIAAILLAYPVSVVLSGILMVVDTVEPPPRIIHSRHGVRAEPLPGSCRCLECGHTAFASRFSRRGYRFRCPECQDDLVLYYPR